MATRLDRLRAERNEGLTCVITIQQFDGKWSGTLAAKTADEPEDQAEGSIDLCDETTTRTPAACRALMKRLINYACLCGYAQFEVHSCGRAIVGKPDHRSFVREICQLYADAAQPDPNPWNTEWVWEGGDC